MADLNSVRNNPQMRASGFAGLFGLFAGLCAIFAACVTLIDWRDEIVQARWPVVPATIERADVVSTARDGGGTLWNLRIRTRFEINGITQAAALTSRPAISESDAACLEAWAAEHPKGSHIDIRYDPSRPSRAVFASDEISSTAGRLHTDLKI
jgi:hypothetical protein